MLKTYQWFLIYFSFAGTVSIVLMFGAQMKMLAREFNIPESYFNWVLVLFPLANGLSRVFAGAVSDKIGREKTMMLFYSVLSLSIFAFVLLAHIPLLFVIIVFTASLLGGAPFCTVSSDDRGLLWGQVLHDKLRHYLYRQSLGRINIRLVERVPPDKIWFLSDWRWLSWRYAV